MKRKIYFYRYWYHPMKLRMIVPQVGFCKNVQGWSFTRNYMIMWFRYTILFSKTIISDLNVNREFAHGMNVKKYMQ